MERIKSINSSALRGIAFTKSLALFGVLLAAFGTLAGCSSLVDTPTGAPAAEPNVQKYYIQMATPKIVYSYTITSTAAYHPASDTLTMSMEGLDGSWNGAPVYSCLWSYGNYGSPTGWFYALSDSQAVSLGVEDASGHYTDSWVDLQSPLDANKSWKFISAGEHVTATIAKYGATAQVDGQTYNDVVMVNYSGDSATTGTEWFQRGKGLIYYNVNRPKILGGYVANKLISIEQK